MRMTARVDGLRIAYDDAGTGEPAFLLLPGWVSDRTVHASLARWLGAHRRVLSLDWRGHGESESPSEDFGTAQLVADALAVVEASGVQSFVPISQAHSGWVTVELLRTVGAAIPRVVLLNWFVLDPPPWFVELNELMQQPAAAASARDQLITRWLSNVTNPQVRSFVHDHLATAGLTMWSRSAREILRQYASHGRPMRALAHNPAMRPTLHLYARPADRAHLDAQLRFAAENPWFQVARIEAESIFTTLEAPREIAARILAFCRR